VPSLKPPAPPLSLGEIEHREFFEELSIDFGDITLICEPGAGGESHTSKASATYFLGILRGTSYL
jgi:hypothetical protein